MSRGVAAIVVLCCLVSESPASDQAVAYQGTSVVPGDVIAMHQGKFVNRGARLLTYGHVALYLGRNAQTGSPHFLCFSTWKQDMQHQAFHGRILDEAQFLRYNALYHNSFDVIRHKQANSIKRERMLREAQKLAKDTDYLIRDVRRLERPSLEEVCSSAAMRALLAGLGTAPDRRVITPNAFEDQRHFRRVTPGKTISFESAIKDSNKRLGKKSTWLRPEEPVSRDPDVEVPVEYAQSVELLTRLLSAGDRVPFERRRAAMLEYLELEYEYEVLMAVAYDIARQEREHNRATSAYKKEFAAYKEMPSGSNAERARRAGRAQVLAKRGQALNNTKRRLDREKRELQRRFDGPPSPVPVPGRKASRASAAGFRPQCRAFIERMRSLLGQSGR